MASFTLKRPDVFSDGTSVSAYPASNWPSGQVGYGAAPVGSATDTSTAASGSVTFDGLAVDVPYVAYAVVGGQHRYIGFIVPADADLVLTPEDFGAKGDGVTDDTAAFQAMIDAIPASGATCKLQAATYVLDSAPRTDRGGNCIVSLRIAGFDTRPIVIQGPSMRGGFGNGAVIKCNRTTDAYSGAFGPPSIFGGATKEQNAGSFPTLFCGPVTFKDVMFLVPDDPSIALIDGLSFGGLICDGVHSKATTDSNAVPTHAHAFGIRVPWVSDFGINDIRNTRIGGMYVAYAVAGPGGKRFTNAGVWKCAIALGVENDDTDAYRHSMAPSRIDVQGSQYMVAGWSPATGVQSITQGHPYLERLDMNYEAEGGPWALTQAVLDANDRLHGLLVVHQNIATANIRNFPVSGARNLRIQTVSETKAKVGTNFGSPGAFLTSASIPAVANNLLLMPISIDGEPSGSITGIRYRVAATTSGNVKVALYSDDGQTLLAQSNSTACGTANALQSVPFTSPVRLAPGRYWAAIIFDNSTTTYQHVASAGYLGASKNIANGSFNLPATVAPPADSDPAASTNPILTTY